MRIFQIGFLANSFVFFFLGFAQAEPQLEVNLKSSKAVKAGESFPFLVQVTWKSVEGDYRFPKPELALENLTVEAMGEANETFQKDGEEWKKKSFRFDLKPLWPGKAKIQPLRINYLDPSQQRSGYLEGGTLELKVSHDYAQFYRISPVMIGLLTVVGILGGWILTRQVKKKEKTAPSAELTLEDRTLGQLIAKRQDLSEVAKVFRAYVGEKNRGQISSEELKTLKRIFDTLEEWQYSGFHESREERERLYSEIVHYVEGKKVI